MTTDLTSPSSAATEPHDDGFGADDLHALRRVQVSGRTRGLDWRRAQLTGLDRMLTERENDIAAALDADLRRTGFDAFIGDIASTRAEVLFARKHVKKWMRRRRVSLPLNQLPSRGWVQFEPLGAVLIIGPWNYPFQLVLSPLVGALAAGNCVVIKPSEVAPATAALLADLLPRYLDESAVKVVQGDAATTQALIALGFDHVVFTGGTEIGRKILAAAAPTLTPVTLELGGKSPTYVASDADIEVAARRIAWTKFFNSGQTCIAPDYVLADRRIVDRLVDALVATIATFRSERPAGEGMPIVNERQYARIVSYLEATNGRIVLGGRADPDEQRIEPTIVRDPSPDEALMQNEIFGPVLPILTVDSADDVIDFVNARPKPLAFYVFSSSTSAARHLIDAIPAGGAVVNHAMMHCLVPQLPFGGVGPSGMGAYHGPWGFEAFSHRKAVLAKPSKPDLSLIYPPYSARDIKILRKLF